MRGANGNGVEKNHFQSTCRHFLKGRYVQEQYNFSSCNKTLKSSNFLVLFNIRIKKRNLKKNSCFVIMVVSETLLIEQLCVLNGSMRTRNTSKYIQI